MNKTERTVVFLCFLALMGVMFWPRPQQPKKAEEAAKVDPAKPSVTPNNQPDPANPVVPPVPPAEKPKAEFTVIKDSVAEFTFSTLGGGLHQVKTIDAPYAGKTATDLNTQTAGGVIGGLANGIGEIDENIYAKTAESATGITFERKTADNLTITKTWTRVENEKIEGDGYIWDLAVTFTSARGEKYTEDDWYLNTGTASQFQHDDGTYVGARYKTGGSEKDIKSDAFNQHKFLWFLWETQAARELVPETLSKVHWVGVNNQYFTHLISPVNGEKDQPSAQFWVKRKKWNVYEGKDHSPVEGYQFYGGLSLPMVEVEPGKNATYNYQVYVGPRSGTLLAKVGGERKYAMDYGFWTGWLSRMFIWLLNFFRTSVVGGFGLAVVLLTFVVRIAIWPLHIKATRSMKRMAKLSPMVHEIREKYKENPQKMQVEMMQLYREYHVSPLGGCLPLLLQMPIFFGYFNMLKGAVEMRGHSFLWIQDLTQPDTVLTVMGLPINPLPLLMTVTMYLQMKMTPTPSTEDDNVKMQRKIFMFMPLMFLLFCYGQASALALYWTVQNIISMGQTYLMNRVPEPELKKRAKPQQLPARSGGGMNRLEKPKGPRPPRTGGGKSAFKNKS